MKLLSAVVFNRPCLCFPRQTRVDAQTLTNGTINPISCLEEGCVDGVVLRGNFSEFSVPDDMCSNTTVTWNALAGDIEAAIEDCANGTRQVCRCGWLRALQSKVQVPLRVGLTGRTLTLAVGIAEIICNNETKASLWKLSDGYCRVAPKYYSRRFKVISLNLPGSSQAISFKRSPLQYRTLHIASPLPFDRCALSLVAKQVDVSRSVIDQYGTMEWEITFTMNPGMIPAGSGDVAALSVVQNLTGLAGYTSQPTVTETQQGSTGLSGTFELDYNDAGGSR